jgi:hypothetical protein
MKILALFIIVFQTSFSLQAQDFLRYKNYDDLQFPMSSLETEERKLNLTIGKKIDTLDYFNEKKEVSNTFLEFALNNGLFFHLDNPSIKLKVVLIGEIFTENDFDSYLFAIKCESENELLSKSLIRINVKSGELCSSLFLYHLVFTNDLVWEEYTVAKQKNIYDYISKTLYSDFVDDKSALENSKLTNSYIINQYGHIKPLINKN